MKSLQKIATLIILAILVSTALRAEIKNPDTFVLATYGTVRTLDPAVCYDATGSQRIWTIYETLLFFDGSHTDKFVPVLATRVPTVTNGGISPDGKTYTFTIREGVRFHEGGELSAEDVAYSLKRHMIVDPDGGPMGILLEALTGYTSTRDQNGRPIDGIFESIDRAVTVDRERVIIRLPRPYPPLLSILAYSAASILNRQWAIAQGCWNGRIADAARFNNPAPGSEPLQNKTNGTGPYRLKHWEPSKQFIFERFDGYWGPAPALKNAIIKYVKEWSTRKLMLQNGDADRVTVDMPYVEEVRALKGLSLQEVKQLSVSFALFCQSVDPTANPNIGSGRLDGRGIPPDFFADIHVRKAFLHAMDRQTYEQDVFGGMVIMPTSPVIEGLTYHRDTPIYEYDLDKARSHLQKAFDGRLWKKGFQMIIAYNSGNEMRAAAALMLAENIMSLNPKFTIEVRNVEWKDYVVQYRSFMFPIFITGWVADFADPHNFVHAFMHSRGVYGRYMGYHNPEVDQLVAQGVNTIDAVERARIYGRLQELWFRDAVGIPLYQQINIRAYRDWVRGYVSNAMLSDAWENLKRLSKEMP